MFEFVEPYAVTPLDCYYLASWAVRRNPDARATSVASGQGELDRDELAVVAAELTTNLGDDEQLSRLGVLESGSWLRAVDVVRASVGAEDEDVVGALEEIAMGVLRSTPPTDVAYSLSERAGTALRPAARGFLFVSRLDEWIELRAVRSKVDRDMRLARDDEWLLRERARGTLADFLRAVAALPDRQRMSLTLAIWRGDARPHVNSALLDVADDLIAAGDLGSAELLFPLGPGERLASDQDIADWLTANEPGSITPQSVAANRSLARRRLSDEDPTFGPLLDSLLPYRKSATFDAGTPAQSSEKDVRLTGLLQRAVEHGSLRIFQTIVEERCPRFDLTIPLFIRAGRLGARSGLPGPSEPVWRELSGHLTTCERCRRTVRILADRGIPDLGGGEAAGRGRQEAADQAAIVVQRALARLLARPDLPPSVAEAIARRLRYQDKLEDPALAALEALAAMRGPGARAARSALLRQSVLHPERGRDAAVRVSLRASRSRGSRPVVILHGQGVAGRLTRDGDVLSLSLHGLPRDLESKQPGIALVAVDAGASDAARVEQPSATVSGGGLSASLPLASLPSQDLRSIREVRIISPPRAVAEIIRELAGDSRQASSAGRLFESLAYARQELRLRAATSVDEDARIGGTHRRMGELHRELGQYEEAREHLVRARDIARAQSDKGLECDAGRSLAEMHLVFGRREQSMAEVEHAIELARALGDAIRQASLLVLRARVNAENNRHAAAAQDAEDAVSLFGSVSDPVGRAAAYNVLALAKRRAGDLGAARRACENAEDALTHRPPNRDETYSADPRWRRDHRKRLLGEVAASRGRILHSEGNFEQALDCFRVSLLYVYEAGWRRGEADALAAMGRSLEALGRTAHAMRLYQRAREIFRVIGETPWEGVMAGALARLRLAAAPAIAADDRAAELDDVLALAEEAHRAREGEPRGEAIALTVKARVRAAIAAHEGGDRGAAVADFERALELRWEAADPRGEAHTRSELAEVVGPEDALAHLSVALRLHRETEDRRGEVTALARLGRVNAQLGALAEAERCYLDAIEIIEGIRGDIAHLGYRHSYLATVVDVYHALARLLADRDPARSLEIVDAARARVLVDTARRDRTPARFVPGEWMASYAGLLDERTAALVYLAGDPLLAFVVTSEGVSVATLDAEPEGLARRVAELRDDVISGLHTYPHGHALHEMLVQPVRAALAGRTSVLLALDGPLHRLPFALLQTDADDPESYLVRDLALEIVPSLTAAATTSGARLETVSTHAVAIGPGREDAAAAGDPAREAGRVADIVERKLSAAGLTPRIERVLGGSALPSAVAAVLGKAGPTAILHIAADTVDAASEALDDPVTTIRPPELLLAEDMVWSGNALLALRLRVQLAMLSADSTALGALVAGEGVMSLARTFLAAGVEAVCATVLPVIGDAAGEFATTFYDALLDGADLAEAVRSAQLELAKAGHAPLHWAGWGAYGYLDALRFASEGRAAGAAVTELRTRRLAVGDPGLEPGTSSLSEKRSNRLS